MRPWLLSSLLFSSWVFAQGSAVERKTVELEWEAVPNVESYEVRLKPKAGGDALVFTAADSRLVQEVPVGIYVLDVRSKGKDEDAYSPWSEAIELAVITKNTVPLKPENGSVKIAEDLKNVPVDFEWAPVEHVKEYTIKVWSEIRKDVPWTFTTSKTATTLKIPPGEIYYWQVFFDSVNSVTYNQSPPIFTFTLQGIRLVRPEITSKPTFGDVKFFSWKRSPGASEYLAKLSYRHLDETEYKVIREETVAELEWPTQRLTSGQYKMEVQARSRRRAPSEVAQVEFTIKPTEAELLQALGEDP